jgi:hypothetical protein
VNDLIVCATDDVDEAWDVWCNIAALHHDDGLRGGARLPAIGIEDLLARASMTERRILVRYQAANRALADGLGRLRDVGALRCGPRAIVANLVLFHWNRYGIELADRAKLYGGMCRALDPHRNVRSGTMDGLATSTAAGENATRTMPANSTAENTMKGSA